MIQVVKLNEGQCEKIKPYVVISEYGPESTFFKSIEDIINADKVVTLNGHAMWKDASTVKSIAERIEERHMIFKLPNGKFAVASQSFIQDICENKKIINIDEDQKSIY